MKRKRNKSKKLSRLKKIILAAAILMVSILGIIGLNAVYAALTDKDEKANDFQIANLRGDITEKFVPPTKDDPIQPGDTYPKEVKVTNKLNAPFFVRVLVIPEVQAKDGTLLPSEIGKDILVDLDPNWVLGEDGFYYYLKKVSEKEETTPVFKNVKLAKTYDEEYEQASMQIALKSETVTSSGKNYRKAWWRGEIPTEKNLKIVDTELSKIGGGK
ncbi:hypothetical protein [Vagococcus carniphilus]|uniref:hypothetical protein n=1 Tax=Vagococcus carniphilus TaxID=218144 RepID=UPI003BAB60BD